MKRYFEVIGENLTLELDMKKGYFPSVEKISKHFKTNLREVDRKEFNRLTKEFTNSKADKEK